jgi:hypothetical protein
VSEYLTRDKRTNWEQVEYLVALQIGDWRAVGKYSWAETLEQFHDGFSLAQEDSQLFILGPLRLVHRIPQTIQIVLGRVGQTEATISHRQTRQVSHVL